MSNSDNSQNEQWNIENFDLNHLLDDAFEDVNYLNNYDDNNLQCISDLDLSLLLPDTPPDTPDNESQASNPSDNGSDAGYSNHSSPSSSGSLNSSISCSSSDFLYSSTACTSVQQQHQSLHMSNQHYLVVPQAVPETTIINPQPSIMYTNGYSTYQPFVQTIPFVKSPTMQNTKLSSFRPIACKPTTILSSSSVSSSASLLSPLPPPLSSLSLGKKENESLSILENNETLKKMKIEERKKKNRIASTNSRIKQKDHLLKLETSVKELNKECDNLREENKRLKSKINELESILGIDHNIKDYNGNHEYSNKSKAKISMFAVLCFVCFQISPFFNSTQLTSSDSVMNSTAIQLSNSVNHYPVHHGRHLLWAMNNSKDINEESQNSLDNYAESFKNIQNQFNNSKPEMIYRNSSIKCSDYFNVTESIRLENELRDLLTRLKFEDRKREEKRNKRIDNRMKNKKLLFDSKHVPIPRLKMWMQKQKYGAEYFNENFPNDEQNKQESFIDYENLLDNVHRRDDTFYYLSYSSHGHMFLPPISNRTDIRPRFSFLIPSFNNLTLDDAAINQSKDSQISNSSHGQMVLLQIDCQVINTKVTLINSNPDTRQVKNQPANRKILSPISAPVLQHPIKKEMLFSFTNSTGK